MGNCETCMFWDKLYPKGITGNCRRYPPIREGGRLDIYDPNMFPVTMMKSWCGEFKPRNQK